MSVPHTGKLKAQIHGRRCSFNGEEWESADLSLAESLNLITELVPTTHYTIQEIAETVFRRAGLADVARIISVEFDQWPVGIPDDAIDYALSDLRKEIKRRS